MRSLVLLFILMSTLSIFAQEELTPKLSIQLVGGIGKTGEHVGPFYPLVCYEGCTFQKQVRKRSGHLELGFFYNFSNRQALRLGIGISQIKFGDIWFMNDVNSPGQYREESYKFVFSNLLLGHNYSFLNGERVSIFIQNNMVLDFLRKQDDSFLINKIGVSYKGLLGMTYAMNHKVKLQSNLFYKTAFAKYDDLGAVLHSSGISGYKFMPFALGLELGLTVSL